MVAPRMPLDITRTAVSDGKPPVASAIAIATGAVTPLGAMDAISSNGAPHRRNTPIAIMAPVTLPTSSVTVAGTSAAFTAAH